MPTMLFILSHDYKVFTKYLDTYYYYNYYY